ncbi:uncharacterized protein FA14DRAFT_153534 [Meira miltonrushii]|uniref:Secreted protein n=1 Tax=Meira miltonrushii TaxID=1280837 RepID=A0A316VL11_9BASI|nr:uncharacterized protein FA14DRAFT_153534 [Meira miltonrushii]PWN38207.1 hypothetical protein FA14DRAFT_153534 [Meira miltonrushii]
MRIILTIITHTILTIVLSVLEAQAAGSSQGSDHSQNQKLEDARKARDDTTSKMRVMVRGKALNLNKVQDVKLGKGLKSYLPFTEDFTYRRLQNKERKQSDRVSKLERGTNLSSSHQSPQSQHLSGFGSPHNRQGSTSPGSHADELQFQRSPSASSSGSSSGARSPSHGRDEREKMLVQLSNKKGEPVRQGGRDDKGKGKAIARSPTLVHKGSSSDSAHSLSHGGSSERHREELYEYQNSRSLPVGLGHQGRSGGLGSFAFHSPAHSESGINRGGGDSFRSAGRSSRSGAQSVGRSSVGSGGSLRSGGLSPVGKDIEKRIKGLEGDHQKALREILVKGTGIRSSKKVLEKEEKIAEIDQELYKKHRPAPLSAAMKYVPHTHEWDRRKAMASHDKHLRRMEDVVSDVSLHAQEGKMKLDVLTDISKNVDEQNRHRMMMKQEKAQTPKSKRLPPLHP